MTTSSIDAVVQEFADQQGWDKNTVLGLALQYIENQDSNDAFRDFLAATADEENESVGDWEEKS